MNWAPRKAEQGNVGNHYIHQNCLVYSEISHPRARQRHPIELDCTRNDHDKDKAAPCTITVMFKDPPAGMEAEAWRIIDCVTDGRRLVDEVFRANMEKALKALIWQPGTASSSGGPLVAPARWPTTRWQRVGHGLYKEQGERTCTACAEPGLG